MGAGLPPDRFWDITPRLCVAEMEAARDRLQRDRDDRIELAWMVAALGRADRLPSLESLLDRQVTAKPQTVEEQEAMLRILANVWG